MGHMQDEFEAYIDLTIPSPQTRNMENVGHNTPRAQIKPPDVAQHNGLAPHNPSSANRADLDPHGDQPSGVRMAHGNHVVRGPIQPTPAADAFTPLQTDVINQLRDISPGTSLENIRLLVREGSRLGVGLGPRENELLEYCRSRLLAMNEVVIANPGSLTSSSSNTISKTPLQQLLNILPDANADKVSELLRAHGYKVEVVVDLMITKGYEKVAPDPRPIAPKFDFTSEIWETSQKYREQAIKQLRLDFPYLLKDSIQHRFQSRNHHYYPTRCSLEESTGLLVGVLPSNARDEDFQKKLSANGLSLKPSHAAPMRSSFFTQPITDEVLLREVEFAKETSKKKQHEADALLAKQLLQDAAYMSGDTYECGCCCDSVPFDLLIQCTEGHLFCITCLQRYTETSVFSDGKSTITCMSQENCSGTYTDSQMRKALPEKVYEKYVEACTRDAAKAANLEDLFRCHSCGFQAELPKQVKVFDCPNVECRKQTCRDCGEEAHIPLRCEEVEKKEQTDSRLKIEEALTTARLRVCVNPKCKTRFYKTEGCNKMQCVCGTVMCYICKKDITKLGYKHFCQTPHCTHGSCGMCVLFTDSVEDDRMAMYNAGLQVKRTLETCAAGPDSVQVDLNQLVEGGVPQSRKRVRIEVPAHANRNPVPQLPAHNHGRGYVVHVPRPPRQPPAAEPVQAPPVPRRNPPRNRRK